MLKPNKTTLCNFNNGLFSKDILIIFFCFILGIILGTAHIKINGITSNFDLNFFLNESWFESFVNNFKYLLLLFLLAFTAFGKIAIPLVFTLKGFYLSAHIASAVMHSGIYGFLTSLIYAGVVLVFILPVLLIFSKHAIDVSSSIFALFWDKKIAIKTHRSKAIEFVIVFFIATTLVLLLSFINPGIEFILK